MNTSENIAKHLFERHADELLWLDGVPSPCMSICQMKLSLGRCVGCHRTLDEIAQWADMDDAEKRATWDRLLARAQPDLPKA
jgi:predicted Fe-S protein YdhL (DUF1289 family)